MFRASICLSGVYAERTRLPTIFIFSLLRMIIDMIVRFNALSNRPERTETHIALRRVSSVSDSDVFKSKHPRSNHEQPMIQEAYRPNLEEQGSCSLLWLLRNAFEYDICQHVDQHCIDCIASISESQGFAKSKPFL